MPPKNRNIIHSFISAFKGIGHVLSERNFLIGTFAGILAFYSSIVFGLSRNEKIIILLLTGFVLATEAINSACERILNFITREHNKEVAHIKEILAGAVLIYAITAAIIGIWIFGHALIR